MKLLLVQFKSDLLTTREEPKAKAYYDKLYRTRAGYSRLGPVWEIPQWIAEMKRNFPEADVLFAESVADVQSRQAKYSHLAFSALDCNWHLIRKIANGFGNGKVIVGGYCDRDYLWDLPNVVWCDSIEHCCNKYGVEYRTGIDYGNFAGAKTIGRLSMSTGCRHRCKFCIVPNEVVKKSGEDIYQQVEEISRLDSPLVYIDDKTFGQCENRWRLPTLYKRFAYDMPRFDGFIVQTTARQLQRLDDDFLLAAGIRYVELGVESYNDDVLAALRKPHNETDIDGAVRKLRRLGIKLVPNLVIGLPGETMATYGHTLNWLETNRDVISHVNVYSLVVYKDSKLADEIEYQEKDFDETVVGKSWHKDKLLLHEKYAEKLYDFGTDCLCI